MPEVTQLSSAGWETVIPAVALCGSMSVVIRTRLPHCVLAATWLYAQRASGRPEVTSGPGVRWVSGPAERALTSQSQHG